MTAAAPIFQIRDLTYSVDGHTILDHVSLEIDRGEIVAILGLSGSGKTTLLRLLSGLIRPTHGSILVLGQDIAHMRETELNAVRRHIGLVFQFGALFDSLTIQQNVGFRLYEHTNRTEADIRGEVAEKLRLVGLSGTEEKSPSELSGGMQKRAGIARALMADPEILLYDEPTSGLDPIIAATIDELIVRLREQIGVTEIIVSHDIHTMLRIADRIALLYDGHFHLVGTADDFRASTDPVVRQFINGETEGPIQVT